MKNDMCWLEHEAKVLLRLAGAYSTMQKLL